MAALAVVAALAGAPKPALAAPFEGQILLATFGSPAIPRLAHAQNLPNGVAGWVLEVAPGRTRFSLAATARPTGLEDFDLFFYATLDDLATEPVAEHARSGDEAGSIPASARWVVITLAAGAQGSFSYTTF